MTYEQYLMSCLLRQYSTKFRQMEYDLQYSKAIELYRAFIHSETFLSDAPEYDCQEAWIIENKHLI
jgi:hypothetical protein